MNILDKIKKLYQTVYITIVPSTYKTDVLIAVYKAKNSPKFIKESFDTNETNKKLVEFITTYMQMSPIFYTTVLCNVKEEGAIPTCNKMDSQSYIDLSTSITVCYKNSWSAYASIKEVDEITKRYEEFGFDYLISAFSVIETFFHDKISGKIALYTLLLDDVVYLCIYEDSKLLYARKSDFKDIEEEQKVDHDEVAPISMDFDLESDDFDDEFHLDDIEMIDDFDNLDDLGNIEDLDSADDIEEFEQAEERTPQDDELEDDSTKESLINLDLNFKRFLIIQKTLKDFYSNPDYESNFIENIYIADSVHTDEEFKNYLEEELFLSVFSRTIDINEVLVQMTKEEVENAS